MRTIPVSDAATLVAVGQGLVAVRDWTFLLGPGLMPAFNALMFATLLYRSRLVPRIIPALGLIGAPMLISSTLGTMFGVNTPMSAWSGIATAPIFIWELSVGLWMAIKGFDRSAPIIEAMTVETLDVVDSIPAVAKTGVA